MNLRFLRLGFEIVTEMEEQIKAYNEYFNDKGGKIEDEKGARTKHSCVRRKVLIILP